MASFEHEAIVRLTLSDLPDCLALSTEVGWNQVAADWRIFFDHGLVWGIHGGTSVIACAALLPYPPGTAWISMVLTTRAARRQGLASRLVAAALAESAKRGLSPQLDATPRGERVYTQLGFSSIAGLTRWRRRHSTPTGGTLAPHTISAGQFRTACHLDAQALAFDRPTLLHHLLARGPAVVTEGAFAFSRDGRTARHVGPVVATTRKEARRALAALLKRLETQWPVIIDANDAIPGLAVFLEDQGFRPERPFQRMAKSPASFSGLATYMAAAGPEFG